MDNIEQSNIKKIINKYQRYTQQDSKCIEYI